MTPDVLPQKTPFANGDHLKAIWTAPPLLRQESLPSLMEEERDPEAGNGRSRKRKWWPPHLCPYTDVDRGWSWLALLATFLANTIMGAQYCSVNIFYAQFLEVFGESRAYTSWFGSLNAIVLYSSGSLGSVLIPKIGVRNLFFLSGLAVCASFITISFSYSLVLNIVAYGVMGGIGYGFVLTGVVAVNARYFKKYIYQVTSVSFVGGGLGTLVYGPTLGYLIKTYEWRGAAQVYAGISLLLCLVGFFVFPERRPVPSTPTIQNERPPPPPTSLEETTDMANSRVSTEKTLQQLDEALRRMCANAQGKPSAAVLDVTHSQEQPLHRSNSNPTESDDSGYSGHPGVHQPSLLAITPTETTEITPLLLDGQSTRDTPDQHKKLIFDPAFWMLSALGFFWGVGAITFLAVFKDLTTSSGLPDLFNTAVLLFGGGNTLTRIIISFLPFGQAALRFSISLMLGSIVFAMFTVASEAWAFLTLSAVAGSFLGFTFVMLPVSVGQVYGRRRMAVTYGYVLFSVGLSNAVGPPLIGYLRDTTQSYTVSLWVMAGATLIAAIISMMLHLYQLKRKTTELTQQSGEIGQT